MLILDQMKASMILINKYKKDMSEENVSLFEQVFKGLEPTHQSRFQHMFSFELLKAHKSQIHDTLYNNNSQNYSLCYIF